MEYSQLYAVTEDGFNDEIGWHEVKLKDKDNRNIAKRISSSRIVAGGLFCSQFTLYYRFCSRILYKLLKGIYTFRQAGCKMMKILEVRSFHKQDVKGEKLFLFF